MRPIVKTEACLRHIVLYLPHRQRARQISFALARIQPRSNPNHTGLPPVSSVILYPVKFSNTGKLNERKNSSFVPTDPRFVLAALPGKKEPGARRMRHVQIEFTKASPKRRNILVPRPEHRDFPGFAHRPAERHAPKCGSLAARRHVPSKFIVRIGNLERRRPVEGNVRRQQLFARPRSSR